MLKMTTLSSGDIYSLVIGGIVVCLLLFQLIHKIFCTYQSYIRPVLLTRVTYPHRVPLLSWTYPLRVIFLIAYLAVTALFNAVGIDDISAASSRAAKLALLNLSLLFFCTHEFGCYVLGLPLNAFQIAHRAIGAVVFLEALIHVGLQIFLHAVHSHPINTHDTVIVYGVIAIVLLTSLFCFSVLKSHLYEIFIKIHTACALALLFALWKHLSGKDPSLARYLYGSAAVYGVTILLQFQRVLFRNISFRQRGLATFQTRGTFVIVRIRLARPWQIQAGQRINICFPGVSMLSMFQMHSFVVSWWEEDDQGEEIISLLVKPRSGLTRQFGDRLREPNEYCVIIDSPYGPDRAGGMIRDVCDYGHILMIATGIGIAAQVPYIKELLDGQRKGIVRTQRITLVWELDLFQEYYGVKDWLQQLVIQDNTYKFQVLIFDTSRPRRSDDPQLFGKHELIKLWGDEPNWEQQLLREMNKQVGTMLITVSAKRRVREQMRALAIKHKQSKVELFELEFQPWGRRRSVASYIL